jgi:glycine/D-amino acid oxidase-like deaminating enzyme
MRPAEIRIVGQGLAGTLLAWACEAAGVRFHLIDPGHAAAASRVGAGIINPVTGRRLVKSWRVDALLGPAVTAYRVIERELKVPLLRQLRVRRELRTVREREIFAQKRRIGELDPYLHALPDREDAFLIEPVFHVDLPRLIDASRQRWRRRGVLSERSATAAECSGGDLPTVACLGAAEVPWRRVVLEQVKGELLHLETTANDAGPTRGAGGSDEIRNDGHWLLPLPDGAWAVGATYDRTALDLEPSPGSRELLLASARRLGGDAGWRVRAALAGWRTSAPDLRPVAGWLPGRPGQGICNGLGSKGALLGPWLAQQWVDHLRDGRAFDPAVVAERCALPG